jgi:DNA helicase-2/ATP-dependent DNA helicase PcrA
MTSAPLFQPKSLAPSPQQIELQTSRKKSIIVSANAGAAKTTSLALKVAEVLELQRQKMGRYFPKRILTLTYTDVARSAFKRALEKIGVAPDVIEELWISTFDDFSIYMMKELEGGQARIIKAPEELKDIITRCLDEVRDRAIHRPDRNLWLPSYEDKGFYEYFLNATLRLKGKMVLPKAGWSDEPINAVLAENTDEDYSILRIFQCFEALRRYAVSGWARHLDRAADSGLRLPAVWQQFPDATVHMRWQSCQHVPQIGPRVMAMQPCGLQQAHHDGRSLTRQFAAREEPCLSAHRPGPH